MSFKIDQIPSFPLLVFHDREQAERNTGGGWGHELVCSLFIEHWAHIKSQPPSVFLPSFHTEKLGQNGWWQMSSPKENWVGKCSKCLWCAMTALFIEQRERTTLAGSPKKASPLWKKKKNEEKDVGETRQSDLNSSYHLLNVSTVSAFYMLHLV